MVKFSEVRKTSEASKYVCYWREVLIFNFYFLFFLFLNCIHLSTRRSKPVLIVNIVGIPTCSQHLLT